MRPSFRALVCGVRLALVFICGHWAYAGELPTVHIGAIFEGDERTSEQAFRNAVDLVNTDAEHALSRFRLAGVVQRVARHDAFHAHKAACKLLSMGVMAIVGPTSAAGSAAVSAVCRRSRVPHLVTLGQDVDEDAVRHPDTSVSVRLSPEQSGLSRALRDLVTRKAWSSFTLLYEDSRALVRLRELLLLSPAEDVLFRLRQRSPSEDLRKVFREVGRRGESNLMLDVPAGRLREYLLQAQQVGMLTEYHNYIATSLDLHTLDLRHFYSSRCNLTGFQLVDPDKPGLKTHQDERVVAGADPLAMLSPRAKEFQRSVKSDAALAHDAVLSFARGLQALSRARSLEPKHGATCDPGSTPWAYGLSLATQIKAGSVTGLSGRVQFDSFGARTNISFNLVELKDMGLSRAGTWDATRGIHYRQNYSSLYQEVALSLRNKTFRVTTILSEPYVMLKSGSKTTASEGDRLEGFCIDLLREMALLLGFRFEIRLVRDSAYGVSNEHGEWNGLVREVMDREADLAIGDLTITLARDRAVDFTLPFMNTGIGILYRKPAQDSRLFYFLLPLSLDVWLCVLGAYLGTGALLHLVARMAPLEWRQPEQRQHSAKCDCDRSVTDKPRNVFSLYNSLWYTTTALLYQSCETNPRAASTRLVAITWWLFSLVMVSFYTANMAAFLVNEKLKFPIENVHDLARQSKIQYGCVVSGSTAAFFKESKLEPFEKMWTVMSSSAGEVLTASNAEGVERVLRGNYAFFMESSTIEYLVDRDCRLAQIGGPLDSKGYGFALPRGSPYTPHLSSAILQLQDSGVLQKLKKRWWTGHCSSQESSKVDSSEEVNALNVSNVGGIFLVLLGGLGVSSVIAILEFVWKTRPSNAKHSSPGSCALKEISREESKTSLSNQSMSAENAISVLPPTVLKVDIVDTADAQRPDVS